MSLVHPKFEALDNNERINALYQAIEDLAAGRRLSDVFEVSIDQAPPVQAISTLTDAFANLDERVSRMEHVLLTMCDRLETIPGLGAVN